MIPPQSPSTFNLPMQQMGAAKALFALLCCTLFACPAFSQDIITRTDSVRIEATVVEVGNEQIRYRLYGKPDSAVYTISTLDVTSVAYEDGTRRAFAPRATPGQTADDTDYTVDWGRNLVSLSVSDLVFQNITFSYERIAASGMVGVKVPLSLGLNPREIDYDYSLRDRKFSAGLALHWYPFGQGRFSYYLGPQVELSFINYLTYYYDYTNPYPVGEQLHGTARIFSLALSNGMYYQFSKSFYAALDLGLAVRTNDRENVQRYEFYLSRFFIPVTLQAGLRF